MGAASITGDPGWSNGKGAGFFELVFFLLVAFLIVDEMAFTILLDLRAMLLVVRGGVGDGGCENICLEGELRQIPSTFGRSESGKDSWPVHSMCWGIMLPCAGS